MKSLKFLIILIIPLIASSEKETNILYSQNQSNFLFTTSDSISRPKEMYVKSEDSLRYDQLLLEFGNNKILPKGFEIQALIALSHYPTLKNEKIEFRFRNAKSAHSSRPNFISFFRKRNKRKYVITISKKVKAHLEGGRSENLSYNAQIGVLGHEVGHVYDYTQKKFGKLTKLAIEYTREKTIEEIEHRVDSITINHGLGYQLRQWSSEVREILASDHKENRYLSPLEINNYMESHSLYQKNDL